MLARLLKRLLTLAAVVWAAMTLNFFIPQLSPRNPIAEKLTEMADTSGYDAAKIEAMANAFADKFGLNEPVMTQYWKFMTQMVRLDFGQSIVHYPRRVNDMIAASLPWTLGLLFSATLIAFLLGTFLGALTAWKRDSLPLKALSSAMIVLSAIPFYLIGLVLVYFLAARAGLFPISGAYGFITIPNLSWSFALEVLKHAFLPALSIILASVGTWAIAMRGMMVTVQGSDYVTFAEAKGLKPGRIFSRYAMRTAILPQVTMFALALGQVVTGSVLVEIVFSYPGLGTLLRDSVQLFDYPAIYAIIFILTATIAVSMFAIELIYPLLDPRVRKGK